MAVRFEQGNECLRERDTQLKLAVYRVVRERPDKHLLACEPHGHRRPYLVFIERLLLSLRREVQRPGHVEERDGFRLWARVHGGGERQHQSWIERAVLAPHPVLLHHDLAYGDVANSDSRSIAHVYLPFLVPTDMQSTAKIVV